MGKRGSSNNTIRLAERFASSGGFRKLFQEGMGLVEESATYLDGAGRAAVKNMERGTSLVYGTESMRLTTRLMQLASWLLLQRAANNGEMDRPQLLEERKKVRLETLTEPLEGPEWPNLPDEFITLVKRSLALQKRIRKLDEEIYGRERAPAGANPVDQQINLLSTALGAMRKT